jgi:hypothetical protein
MTQHLSDTDLKLWRKVVDADHAFINARMELFANCSSLVEVARHGLKDPTERWTALGIIALMRIEDRLLLFDSLLDLASSSHAYMGEARELILSLPREWVLANVEKSAEPLLRRGDYSEYRGLLALYAELDHDLACRLARRAAEDSDEDIREAGEDFLEKLSFTK